MPPQPYRFFINPFLVVTKNSYKKALSIGEDHKARLIALQADPDVATILAATAPILTSYKTSNQNLQAAEGTYEGKTQTVEELFDQLNKQKLPFWEGQIRSIYYEGTATERAIFPDKRKPFQSGTYEQRISAIQVLGDRCAADPDPTVAGVSGNILAFHTQIESARVLQQSAGEGAVAALRNLRETARVLLCQQLYGNLGLLMNKHRANPLDIDQYFEMTYLRSGTDNTEAFEIDPNQVVNIFDNAVAGDVTGMKIKNTSDEDVTVAVYFAPSLSAPPAGTIITLHQGEEKVLNEADLGPVQPFLNALNQSLHKGTFNVTEN